MSFHEPTSDISRLNRAACFETVTVDPATFIVLTNAQTLAEESDGVFDITVASRLVAWGFLPRPDGPSDPDARPSWTDIELTTTEQVRFRRPLWIDLGGIAKGYAVDQAIAAMNLPAHARVSVNAGGDLRVAGPAPERVRLRATVDSEHVPILEIENASLASSSGWDDRRAVDGETVGPHINGKTRRAVGTQSFVSVVARDCMTADALTKIVLTQGQNSVELLIRRGATAYFHDGGDWQTFGAMN
jgi:thiamine biosynthesis lipoprotein